jgi:TolB protein
MIQMLWSADATIEVVKSVDTLSTLIIEDSSPEKSDISQKFAKMLAKDMEVISLFAVDQNIKSTLFESAVQGDARYVLRYRLQSDGNGGVHADVKLFQDTKEVFVKNYQLKQSEMAVFLSHTIAYDINAKLGGAPMEWIKRKVVFVRLTSPRNSELVVSDYTLS